MREWQLGVIPAPGIEEQKEALNLISHSLYLIECGVEGQMGEDPSTSSSDQQTLY